MQNVRHAAYTSTQTGTALWTPATGKTIRIDHVDIQGGGTTAGTIRLWFAEGADTTYSEGVDQHVMYFNLGTPSASVAPGKVLTPAAPMYGSKDRILRVTTSDNITVDVTVYGGEE